MMSNEYQETPHSIAEAVMNDGEGEETDESLKPIIAQKKPKRNDPCPCGSGKKYKNCCGRSGPRKGLLA